MVYRDPLKALHILTGPNAVVYSHCELLIAVVYITQKMTFHNSSACILDLTVFPLSSTLFPDARSSWSKCLV